MSDMFTTEGEWQKAFEVAELQITAAIQRGELEWPLGHRASNTIRRLAQDVATAVIRSVCAQDDLEDISTVPGVDIEKVPLAPAFGIIHYDYPSEIHERFLSKE